MPKNSDLRNWGKPQDSELFVYSRRPQETRLEQGQDPLNHNQSLTLEKGMSTNSLDSTILNPPNIVQAVDTYLDIQKLGRRVGRWVVGVLTSQDTLMIGR